MKVVPFQVPHSQTVSVNVSWTPGYSGGYVQGFSIHYRHKGSGTDFTEEFIGRPPTNIYTVQKLSPTTQYEFMMILISGEIVQLHPWLKLQLQVTKTLKF